MKEYKCDACVFVTFNQEQYAGHRSAHVRRGEVAKKAKRIKQTLCDHKCDICGLVFNSGWKLGGHITFHNKTFDQFQTTGGRKRFLIRERGHQCENCKITEWCGKPAPIQLDHVNGDSDDNRKENLRLLCPNCHAQTDTYCGKNQKRRKTKSKRGVYTQRHYDKVKNSSEPASVA